MDVLIVGETHRTPELRHEVPLAILDPFVYAETNGRRVAAISAMEGARIDELGTGVEARPLEEFGVDELRQARLDPNTFERELTRRIVRGLGISSAVVPHGFPLGIADALRADGVELVVDQQLFDDRRRVKTEHELRGIGRAQAASEKALAAVVQLLQESEPRNDTRVVDGQPLTCELLRERIQSVLVAQGAFAQETIVSHGPQTAIPHDEGSGAIGADDVVLVDLFPMDLASACYADMTRTFAVGKVDASLQEAHDLCRQALEAAVAAVRAGVHGTDLHRQACDLFAANGYPTTATKKPGEVLLSGFTHALGHGIGLEAHEAPGVGLMGQELVAGDVIAVEPGLYREGIGGIRIEDLVRVTDSGCEVLTDFAYDLAVA
jgi:Xaa-Pro aminopeptidase